MGRRRPGPGPGQPQPGQGSEQGGAAGVRGLGSRVHLPKGRRPVHPGDERVERHLREGLCVGGWPGPAAAHPGAPRVWIVQGGEGLGAAAGCGPGQFSRWGRCAFPCEQRELKSKLGRSRPEHPGVQKKAQGRSRLRGPELGPSRAHRGLAPSTLSCKRAPAHQASVVLRWSGAWSFRAAVSPRVPACAGGSVGCSGGLDLMSALRGGGRDSEAAPLARVSFKLLPAVGRWQATSTLRQTWDWSLPPLHALLEV